MGRSSGGGAYYAGDSYPPDRAGNSSYGGDRYPRYPDQQFPPSHRGPPISSQQMPSGYGGGGSGSHHSGGSNGSSVRVDDQKVASLVAMDFPPDRVVAALKKFNNNVEQALNELLSS